MEQALPVEYVPFDETVELTGSEKLFLIPSHCFSHAFPVGDVSEMSVEQYLSWVRYE
jgi:hypothetical protein